MQERELKNLRTAHEKHFLQPDGSIIVELFDDVIHFKKQNQYEEIDNTLEKQDNYYCNRQNAYQVYFKEKSVGYFMKLKWNDHKIEFSLPQALPVSLQWNESKNALYQTVNYPHLLSGLTLAYDITPTKVKENIYVENPESLTDLTFSMKTDLTLALTKENQIRILEEQNQLFLLEAPHIIDQNGTISHSVTYELIKQNQEYLLTLKIDKETLLKEHLVYPINIDPTITSSTQEQNVYDTYIFEGDTNIDRNHTDILKAGVEIINGKERINRTLLKFELPTIGTGSQVIDAQLSLIGYGDTTSRYETNLVTIHEITAPWEEATATWEQMHDKYHSRIEGIMTCGRSFVDYDKHLTPYECREEITNLVQKWYADKPNYGMMIKAYQEESHPVLPAFFSKNNTVLGENPKPLLTITYRNQNGLEPYLDYQEQSLENARLYVNRYNGNLTGIFPLANTTNSFFPSSVSLVYNTNDVVLSKDYGFGYGFKLNL